MLCYLNLLVGILFYCLSPSARHMRCFTIALRCGADVNNKTFEGVPILSHAAELANEGEVEDMVLLLLQKGADPCGKQEVSFSPSQVVLFPLEKSLNKQWLDRKSTEQPWWMRAKAGARRLLRICWNEEHTRSSTNFNLDQKSQQHMKPQSRERLSVSK